jgi:hypothetical protein
MLSKRRLRWGVAIGVLPALPVVGLLLVMPLISSAAPTSSTTPTTTTPTTPTTPTTTATTTTPAPPPLKPPLATTGYAPEVTETTASVKGGVSPRGVESSYFFQYGPSTAYGAQTTTTPAGAGTQEVRVVQALAGLTPNTLYHYRLVATSTAGTAVGQDRTFTTKKIPLTIALSVAPNPAMFGSELMVRGTVSGSDAANQWIVLQTNPFPYLGGFLSAGVPEETDTSGNFAIPLSNLPHSTQLRVATVDSPKVFSSVVTELVAVRVSLHAHHTSRRGYVRLDGTVLPSQPGAHVSLQWIRAGHRPMSIGRLALHGAHGRSRFNRVLAIHHPGRYRAFVEVSSGKWLSYYSRSILIR